MNWTSSSCTSAHGHRKRSTLDVHFSHSQAQPDLWDHGLRHSLNGESLSLLNETAVSPIFLVMIMPNVCWNTFSLISLHMPATLGVLVGTRPAWQPSTTDFHGLDGPLSPLPVCNRHLVLAVSVQ